MKPECQNPEYPSPDMDVIIQALILHNEMELTPRSFAKNTEREIVMMYWRTIGALTWKEAAKRVLGRKSGKPLQVVQAQQYFRRGVKQLMRWHFSPLRPIAERVEMKKLAANEYRSLSTAQLS